MKFNLVTDNGKTDSGETIYLYAHNADGQHRAISFNAHPTIPFQWQVRKSVNMTTAQRHALIGAFVNAGVTRGERSFADAIATLTISE